MRVPVSDLVRLAVVLFEDVASLVFLGGPQLPSFVYKFPFLTRSWSKLTRHKHNVSVSSLHCHTGVHSLFPFLSFRLHGSKNTVALVPASLGHPASVASVAQA